MSIHGIWWPLSTLLAWWALLAMLAGCGPKAPPVYIGATEPMSVVVEKINQNNRPLPTLYARHYFEGTLVDPQSKKEQFINTSGDLFVRKPGELLLRGRKDPGIKIFEMGSTADIFWLTAHEGPKKQWWGHYRNLGKPCVKENLPIRPDLIGEVLGVGDISTNFGEPPFPIMQFHNEGDCYMLTWVAKQPDRWIAQKSIWYNRERYLPVKVLLYDENGRVVLRANLSEHQPVKIEGVAAEKWPKVATNYDLFFPDSRSKMSIKLSDMSLTTKNGHPKAGTIRFQEDPDVTPVQVDADCDK
jgi:hypothetical protein